MGNFISSLFSRLFSSNRERKLLLLGLDNSGKTTLLYRLKLGRVISTVPTVGFNVETLSVRNLRFAAWDLGGQSSLRLYWKSYFVDTDAVVFCVDCTDQSRFAIAKAELEALYAEPALESVPILVLANKQDCSDATPAGQVASAIVGCPSNRPWSVVPTSVLTGEGIDEAFNWLCDVLGGVESPPLNDSG
ncbi:hypothetical protein P9112_005389 [Eukaryota sp. TZLM1-RC]